MRQSIATTVQDLLPDNLLLNTEDNDFISIEGRTNVDKQSFRHVFTCQEEEIVFDSESSDENSGHSYNESGICMHVNNLCNEKHIHGKPKLLAL